MVSSVASSRLSYSFSTPVDHAELQARAVFFSPLSYNLFTPIVEFNYIFVIMLWFVSLTKKKLTHFMLRINYPAIFVPSS